MPEERTNERTGKMAFMPIGRAEWQRDERGQGRHAEEVQSRHVMAHGTNLANEVLFLQP
jgi:hypothetical protein